MPEASPIRQNRAVIHFGGVENPFVPMERIAFPFAMVKALASSAVWDRFDEVVVAAGEKAVGRLKAENGHLPWRFVSLPHAEFVRLVAQSQLLVTTPGLTSMLEAFALQVPALLLPPPSNSSYRILQHLADEPYPIPLLNWDRFYPDFRIDPAVPGAVATRQIAALVDSFFADEARVELLRSQVAGLVADQPGLAALTAFQSGFLDRLGRNGTEELCRTVIAALSAGPAAQPV
ncbi:MAG: hypothetical protein ACOY94_16235 [Bacillota bacterium]